MLALGARSNPNPNPSLNPNLNPNPNANPNPNPSPNQVRELDNGRTERFQPLVVPFVVASPSWLTSDEHDAAATQPAHVPWERRKLLFFAGHMPLLHISNIRWNLWRALQGDPRVTLYTTDLLHQVIHARACEQYRSTPRSVHGDAYGHTQRPTARGICGARCGATRVKPPPARNESEARLSIKAFLLQECARYCVIHGDAFLPNCGSSSSPAAVCAHSAYASTTLDSVLQDRHCGVLASHNVSGASEGRIAPVRLSSHAYMSEIMKHRFCVIAPGDDMSTHKIGETMRLSEVYRANPALRFLQF